MASFIGRIPRASYSPTDSVLAIGATQSCGSWTHDFWRYATTVDRTKGRRLTGRIRVDVPLPTARDGSLDWTICGSLYGFGTTVFCALRATALTGAIRQLSIPVERPLSCPFDDRFAGCMTAADRALRPPNCGFLWQVPEPRMAPVTALELPPLIVAERLLNSPLQRPQSGAFISPNMNAIPTALSDDHQ